jgi:hypothetical protein
MHISPDIFCLNSKDLLGNTKAITSDFIILVYLFIYLFLKIGSYIAEAGLELSL